MGLRAMNSAASGMEAYLFNLDSISNNLANAGTTAFKRSRVNFEDVFYEHLKTPGGLDNVGKPTPVGVSVGLGTRIESTQVDHTQGNMLQTTNPLDLAIVGQGFFQVQDGALTLYTRAGNFTTNANGEMVVASAGKGRLLEPTITIPQNATDVSISDEGIVTAILAGATATTQLGQIQTARFINPEGLLQVGDNMYQETDASGTAQTGIPGLDGRGTLAQSFLETSNVEPVRELVDLIKTQRFFELNSQAVQAADQMLQTVANLRRF